MHKKLFISWYQLALSYLLLSLVTVFSIYPLLWMVLSSFKTVTELYQTPFGLPGAIRIGNYLTAWYQANFGRYTINSVIVTSTSVVAMLFLGSLAAHSLVRFTFKHRLGVLYYFLAGQVVPAQLSAIPLLVLMRSLGLMNSHFGMLLVYSGAGLPFVIFLLVGFFRTLPKDVYDAAYIDGCSEFGIFWRIVLPMARAGMMTAAVFQTLWVWNDFFYPLMFLRRKELQTLIVGVFSVQGEYVTDYPVIFAGLTLATIPILLIYGFMASTFTKGITAGAVKG
jgi:raffinose/stachyose/melibiose transport system permease protein